MSEVISPTKTEEPERKPNLNFCIPKGKSAPSEFEDAGIGKEITFTVTGKVTRVSVDEWDGGTFNLSLDIASLSVENVKKKTLDEALSSSRRVV